MRKLRSVNSPIIFSLLFAATRAAFAAGGDATLAKVNGPVFVRAAGSNQEYLARGGEDLLFGDSVRTGPGAVAHLTLGDRGAILLGSETSFTLGGSPNAVRIDVSIGEFLIGLTKKLRASQSFYVHTPAAVAAVRGTVFWGKSDAKKTSTFAGLSHKISVTGAGRLVFVAAGQMVVVKLGHAPTPPRRHHIALAYLNRFKIDNTLQGLDALVDQSGPQSEPAPAAEPLPGYDQPPIHTQ